MQKNQINIDLSLEHHAIPTFSCTGLVWTYCKLRRCICLVMVTNPQILTGYHRLHPASVSQAYYVHTRASFLMHYLRRAGIIHPEKINKGFTL